MSNEINSKFENQRKAKININLTAYKSRLFTISSILRMVKYGKAQTSDVATNYYEQIHNTNDKTPQLTVVSKRKPCKKNKSRDILRTAGPKKKTFR